MRAEAMERGCAPNMEIAGLRSTSVMTAKITRVWWGRGCTATESGDYSALTRGTSRSGNACQCAPLHCAAGVLSIVYKKARHMDYCAGLLADEMIRETLLAGCVGQPPSAAPWPFALLPRFLPLGRKTDSSFPASLRTVSSSR